MEKGWIKLHRKILDCWLWKEKPFDKARAWMDLLLLAMHRDTKLLVENEIIVIQRGSFMTSILKLSERWGWSRNKVKRYMELLESEQMLTTKRTPKGTLVTIVKYDDFQFTDRVDEPTVEPTVEPTDEPTDEPTVEPTDEPTDEPTVEPQNKNIKNIKELKNEKNDKEKTLKGKTESKAYYPNDELLNNAFKEFVSMRNKIKKPLTAQAVTRAMNKLQKLSNGDNDLAIKILNQSVDHCWQDLYDLKKDNGNGNYQKQLGSNSRDAQFWNLMEQIRRDEEDGT